MPNPIIQAMQNSKNLIGTLNNIKNGNVDSVFNQMMQSNPNFRQFVNENQGMSAEQIATKYGIDMSIVNSLMK